MTGKTKLEQGGKVPWIGVEKFSGMRWKSGQEYATKTARVFPMGQEIGKNSQNEQNLDSFNLGIATAIKK